jgi:predicted kinase
MSKVVMLKGLPGSGKSTLAKEIMKEGGNFYRINRDLLREMLFFSEWRGNREDLVIGTEQIVAREILEHQANVIVDDTNLGPKHEALWSDFAAENSAGFEVRAVDTPVEKCIERDEHRDKRVGRSVIMGLAMQYGYYKPKSVVLCDLDGTIANLDHRLQYVKNGSKDWKSFFAEIPNDTLITEVAQQLWQKINQGHELFYISARPDNYRKETEAWLKRVGAPNYKALFMRRAHDKREDSEIKKDLLNQYFPDTSIIHAVFDDRPRVIRMWRENGLNVIDCGNGIEF